LIKTIPKKKIFALLSIVITSIFIAFNIYFAIEDIQQKSKDTSSLISIIFGTIFIIGFISMGFQENIQSLLKKKKEEDK
jgi:ABC-type Na+ efflux pump permease subunit